MEQMQSWKVGKVRRNCGGPMIPNVIEWEGKLCGVWGVISLDEDSWVKWNPEDGYGVVHVPTGLLAVPNWRRDRLTLWEATMLAESLCRDLPEFAADLDVSSALPPEHVPVYREFMESWEFPPEPPSAALEARLVRELERAVGRELDWRAQAGHAIDKADEAAAQVIQTRRALVKCRAEMGAE